MEEQDSLTYGVVVLRLDNGDWWHGHFVRSDLQYHCEFLSRPTNLLFLMVKFGCGVTRKSPDFFLTLDAFGIAEELLPIRYRGDWGERDNDATLKSEASHVQNEILPLLHDCDQFQQAMAAIVHKQAYQNVADSHQFLRITGIL